MSGNEHTSDLEEAEDVKKLEENDFDLDNFDFSNIDLDDGESSDNYSSTSNQADIQADIQADSTFSDSDNLNLLRNLNDIISFQNQTTEKCEKCGEEYKDEDHARCKWCKPCQINDFKKNFTNWTSGNKKIDNFIQERQLSINKYYDKVYEWIPYDQFDDIKKINKSNSDTEYLPIWKEAYSAIWKDGSLCYDDDEMEWMRSSDEDVTLKYLYNSQNITDEFLDEVNTYLTNNYNHNCEIYGISQDPDTKEYILVSQDEYHSNCENCGEIYADTNYEWCKLCHMNYFKNNFTNWTSENEKIDDFIQEMQLSINNFYDEIFEWIPYNQFNDIKEIGKRDDSAIYSAIWKDGSLNYDTDKKKFSRDSNKVVALKCLYNSQNITDEFLNEVKTYSTSVYNNDNNDILEIYGISQNPDTKDYIMVLQDGYCEKCSEKYTKVSNKWCKPCLLNDLKGNYTSWTSGNENFDDLIQEMQSKINNDDDIIFEWIPYNQFNDIKEINRTTEYLATWKDGPLVYNFEKRKYERVSDKKIALKCLNNTQNFTEEFLNEVKAYSISQSFDNINILKIYGISQNPDTKDYIIVCQESYCEKCGAKDMNAMYKKQYQVDATYKWCKQCLLNYLKGNYKNWTSENEKINDFVQEIQSSITSGYDVVFEWIPYNQFDEIKIIGRGGFSIVYSAIWKDGPLTYDHNETKYERLSDKKVALKCLHNSQHITHEFLNEVKAYSMNKYSNVLNVYGISQNPDTKDYIMVLEFAEGGNFNDWMNRNYKDFDWRSKIEALSNIINGLEVIHQIKMVHRDFHTGNILFIHQSEVNDICISDMGLSGKIGEMDKTKVYGVMPYVAPEVLSGKPYTQAADIYSFGMIMYFVVTGKQPFANCAHDQNLALNICNGVRPEIYEYEAPKFYIDLMKKCWNSNPDNRPNAIEIGNMIELFEDSYYDGKEKQHYEIEKQFKEAENYRILDLYSCSLPLINHPQAIYKSRLLNPHTKDLPKYEYDNKYNEFSDDLAVEQLLLQHVTHNEFSDGIAVEQFLLEHVMELDN